MKGRPTWSNLLIIAWRWDWSLDLWCIWQGWQSTNCETGPNQTLDITNFAPLGGLNKSDSMARLAGAAGAADAVDIVFGMLGQIVVGHKLDTRHVDASGSNIGGDQNTIFTIFKTTKGFAALW